MTRKPWATTSEATILTGRSSRTIRRWLADPNVSIDTMTADDGKTRLLSTADLMNVEAEKTSYLTAPSFGRNEDR